MPVLNLHYFKHFFIWVYAVEEGGFDFETTGVPILYAELPCERAFSESYMTVSFVDQRRAVRLLVGKAQFFFHTHVCKKII